MKLFISHLSHKQEDIATYFASSPAYANLNRRLMTLLAQIGPPIHKVQNTASAVVDEKG